MAGKKKKAVNPLLWVVESIMDEPSYIDRAWFGCRAVYLHGRLMLVLCSGEEPWNGLLIPTEKEFHEDIRMEFGNVLQHPVLKKWLYLPENSEDFETVSSELVEAVRRGDRRLGVEPKERRRRRHMEAAHGLTALELCDRRKLVCRNYSFFRMVIRIA